MKNSNELVCERLGIFKMNKLTERQKLVLRELVNFTCEECKKHEEVVGKLQAHRMKRGIVGGKYIPRNIKMLCSECHKEYHGEEFK